MEPHVIRAAGFDANLSPDLFRRHARQYLECHRAYKPVAGYSPVPYFLLCRAIELALKSHHLKTKSREVVKRMYSHDLLSLYRDLPPPLQTLGVEEHALLAAASAKYDVPNKGFEYVSLEDVLTSQEAFPNLVDLEALAVRIVET
jgi:hypothetical protein